MLDVKFSPKAPHTNSQEPGCGAGCWTFWCRGGGAGDHDTSEPSSLNLIVSKTETQPNETLPCVSMFFLSLQLLCWALFLVAGWMTWSWPVGQWWKPPVCSLINSYQCRSCLNELYHMVKTSAWLVKTQSRQADGPRLCWHQDQAPDEDGNSGGDFYYYLVSMLVSHKHTNPILGKSERKNRHNGFGSIKNFLLHWLCCKMNFFKGLSEWDGLMSQC